MPRLQHTESIQEAQTVKRLSEFVQKILISVLYSLLEQE